MARKKVAASDRSDLKWFKLESYRPLRTMDYRQWGQQILKRAMLLQALQSRAAVVELATLSEFADEVLAEQMEDLMSTPLCSYNYKLGEPPLKELSVADFETISSRVRGYNDLASKLGKQPIATDVPIDQAFGLDANFLGHLRLNLLARDSDIQLAVSEWLKSRRRFFGQELHEKSLRNSAINEWLTSNMIPFADLRLWASWKNDRITEDQVIYTLFPDIEATSDREKGPDVRAKYAGIKRLFDKYVTTSNAVALLYGIDD